MAESFVFTRVHCLERTICCYFPVSLSCDYSTQYVSKAFNEHGHGSNIVLEQSKFLILSMQLEGFRGVITKIKMFVICYMHPTTPHYAKHGILVNNVFVEDELIRKIHQFLSTSGAAILPFTDTSC